jgi:hypothetical protein
MPEKQSETGVGRGAWVQALAVGFLVLFFAVACAAQLSPGPLSRAHQSLSGITQCTTCHTVNVGSAELKCAACHTEIAQRLQQRRGLHATMVRNPSDSKECSRCHSEHNGADFNLIHWDVPLERFDHRQTGYVLEGKHAEVSCEMCHTPAHIRPAERPQIKIRDLTKSWLGLTKDCVSCHEDPHAGRLGEDCTQCHNFSDWKAASGFDHSKTRYPLTGLHAQVACEKCHTPGPRGEARLTGLAFGSCKDCHQDPHRGSFMQTCESCHTTNGWSSVRMPASFDHSKTDFPLLGKHETVGCADCHGGGDFKKSIAHARCMDCHTPDPHSGQFRQRAGGGAECASCHNEEGFKPSTYSVEEHARSAYPLEGKHSEVACSECHTPPGVAMKFKIAFDRCTDCHADEHRGQFDSAPHQNRCEDCHDLHGFRPGRFTLTRHQETPFALAGAHIAVPCLDCHKPTLIAGARTMQFHFTNQACSACHMDPHNGKYQAEMNRVLADGSRADCQACHSVQTWRNLTNFDHTQTEFPLTGAHRAVACTECHKASTSTGPSFGNAPKNCEGCHQDIHGGQFARAGAPTTCATCHATARWVPSSFDHDRDSSFPLEGAHQNVPCASCHELRRDVDGRPVLFYKPTPKACADCHSDPQFQTR